MATTDLSNLRDVLQAEAEDLHRQLAELETDGSAAPDFDENFADSAQVAAEVGENQALAATLRDQLVEVEAAVARIDQGTYGACEACGGPIGADRLDAMPSARFCIAHA
ncbi:MAG: TraR/DksA C4-type zinc finger protein [Actinobacteria bacterium]|nr:TraR/DksA C4-type zinc finger protein [Actinomycetota bacterium]